MKKQVMIVDHDPKFRKELRGLLKGHGYKVTLAKHGKEALAKLERNPTDLIISELKMPIMSGYTLLWHIKTREEFTDIPVVIFSDFYVSPSQDDLAWSIGADAFITKPAKPDQFLSLIEGLMNGPDRGEARKSRDPDFEAEVKLKRSYESLLQELESKILELTQANQKLSDSDARMRLLMDSMPVCILLTDADLKIMEANPTCLRLLKARTTEQLLETSLSDIVAKDYHQALGALVKSVLAGADDLQDCEIVDLQGERRWVAITAAPIQNTNGDVESILLALQDKDFQKLQEHDHPAR